MKKVRALVGALLVFVLGHAWAQVPAKVGTNTSGEKFDSPAQLCQAIADYWNWRTDDCGASIAGGCPGWSQLSTSRLIQVSLRSNGNCPGSPVDYTQTFEVVCPAGSTHDGAGGCVCAGAQVNGQCVAPTIALEGGSATRALPAGPALLHRVWVTAGGQPVAGKAVAISIGGVHEYSGVTGAAGEFVFNYVPPLYIQTNDTITASCQGCANVAQKSVAVTRCVSCEEAAAVSTAVGNPIEPGSGEKVQVEVDLAVQGVQPLVFRRSYSSFGAGSELGPNWTHNWAGTASSTGSQARVQPGDGSTVIFVRQGGAWVAQAGADALQDTAGGGLLYTRASDDSRLQFGADGKLETLTLRGGLSYSLSYSSGASCTRYQASNLNGPFTGWLDSRHSAWSRAHEAYVAYWSHPGQSWCAGASARQVRWQPALDPGAASNTMQIAGLCNHQGADKWSNPTSQAVSLSAQQQSCGRQLASVSNAFGRSLNFGYTNGVLTSVSAGVGAVSFSHDSAGRLAAVSQPDASQRLYHYEDARHPYALTGITDEANVRYASFSYDAGGRAVATQHAGGVGSYSVSYPQQGAGAGTLVAGATVDAQLYRAALQLATPLGAADTHTWQGGDGAVRLAGATSTTVGQLAERSLGVAGLPALDTDFLGVQTMYTWDINRRLPTATTYAANRPEAKTVQTQWHATFRLPTLVTEAGRTTAYTYDADGNKLTQTVTDTATNQARTWTWTYNAQKLPATMTDPKNGTWSYAYDTAGNLTSETNPLGHVTSYTHDAAGRVLTQTEPTGLVTSYTYDARGRVLTVSRAGETTTFTYQPTGNLATASFASGLAITYSYDAAQRMTGWSSNRGAQGVYTLDAAGNRTVEQVKDSNGNVIWQLARSINSLNRVQSETLGVNQSTTYAYNANGDATGETNGLNQATSLTLDGLKRVTAITNAANATASLAYDARDSVTSVTDFKGAATTYTRNAFGEAQQEASGDAGTRTTSYDALGLPSQITDALGQATSIQRDALGRPTQLTFQDGKTTILRYDLTGSDYNAAGAPNASKGYLSEVEDRAGITKWQRDIQGRVTQRTQTLKNGSTQTVSYTYNAQGLLDTLTYPGGGQLQHSYDTTGRLSGMSWNGSPLIQNITWNALNQPTGWSWAFNTPVNATRSYDTAGRTTATEITSYSYDAAGRITSLTQNLGQPADSDPNSTSVTFANTTFTVGYDATGRITSFGDGTTTTSFTYDANGNRQSSTTTAGATTTSRTYTVEATSNRLTGFTQDITGPGGNSSTAVSYTYNANGDITADGLRNFSFDAEGRLSSVATGSTQTSPTTRYAHSALGERLFKTEPLQIGEEPEPGQEQNFIEQLFTFFKKLWAPQTTTAEQLGWAYAYDEEGTLLSEIGMGGASSTGQTNYIWLQTPNGPMPVAAIVNGNKYAVHADHLNTPRRLTNQYGEAAWQWKFSAFGDEAPTRAAKRFVDPDKTPGMGSGTVADVTYNLRYPGQTADQESGLYYNYFRSYNSNIGRYPQTDPIGLDGGWNRFAYAEGSATNYTDPLGLLTSADFACMRDPAFCAEIMGDMAMNLRSMAAQKCEDPGLQEFIDSVRSMQSVFAAGTVASAAKGVANLATKVAANWRSRKAFGHTFSEHGAGAKNTRRLADRARGTGQPQGQWTNNDKAAEFLSGVKVDGPASVPIPPGLGQVVKPDGTIVPAGWGTVVPRGDGLRTAYPVIGR